MQLHFYSGIDEFPWRQLRLPCPAISSCTASQLSSVAAKRALPSHGAWCTACASEALPVCAATSATSLKAQPPAAPATSVEHCEEGAAHSAVFVVLACSIGVASIALAIALVLVFLRNRRNARPFFSTMSVQSPTIATRTCNAQTAPTSEQTASEVEPRL